MKKLLVILTILTAATIAQAKTLELGVGNFNSIRYGEDDFAVLAMGNTDVYSNALLFGKGLKLDNLYLGAVAGVSDTDKGRSSGGLDFVTGVEASLIIPFQVKYNIRLEAILTPKFNANTILFGYTF